MAKRIKVNNEESLILSALYAGLMKGSDLMARTGIEDVDVMRESVASLIDKNLVGREGKGRETMFGLTEDGIQFAEEEGLVETEGEEGAEEDETVVEDDEFAAPAPPARRPAAASTKAPARPSTPAARPAASTKAPAAATGKAAGKGAATKSSTKAAQPEAEDDGSEYKLSYRAINVIGREDLERGITVGRETVDAIMTNPEGVTEDDEALAILIRRSVKKYEHQLETRFGVKM